MKAKTNKQTNLKAAREIKYITFRRVTIRPKNKKGVLKMLKENICQPKLLYPLTENILQN